MHPHHSGGNPMSSSQQLHELQKMQRMQQQVQAQLQQASGQQQQMLGSSSGMGALQGLPQMSSQMGFGNQGWSDPNHQASGGSQQQTHRNSLTGMSNYMMQQQNNTAQSLYWNAMHNNGVAGSSSDGGGMPNSSMNNVGGGTSGNLGLMDASMQGLQQMGVTGNQQSHQMRTQMNQQAFGGGSGQQVHQQADLSNAMLAATNAVVTAGGNSASGGMGGNTGIMSSSQSGQMASASNSGTQLLLQHENFIADLKRQLQEQQQKSSNTNSSMNASSSGIPHGNGMERRSSSGSAHSLMSGQPQASMMQYRGSSSSQMLQQMHPGMIQEQGLQHHGNSALTNLQDMQQQHRRSLGGSDQSMMSFMGSQTQGQQMRRTSSTGGSNLLGNVFGDQGGGSGAAGNAAMLGGHIPGLSQLHLSQMAGLNTSGVTSDQYRAQQQLLGSTGMAPMGQDMDAATKAKQLVMSQGQEEQNSYRQTDPKSNKGKGVGGGKAKSRRKSSSSKPKKGGDKGGVSAQGQQSYLDGTFAGGWQSNVDLPDRRQIIYNIVKVIEQMRPDANKMSQKLPMMAKRLEEHLYRSAQTKEEYLDQSTLKKRLQMIAHGLEVHRSASSGSTKKPGKSSESNPDDKQSGDQKALGNPDYTSEQLQQQLQQLQQLQQRQEQKLAGGQALVDKTNPMGMVPALDGSGHDDFIRQQTRRLSAPQGSLSSSSLDKVDPRMLVPQDGIRDVHVQFAESQTPGIANSSGILKTDSAKYQDSSSSQKKKVIRQQQQRLLLLRHASKCTAGSSCKTRCCAQMVSLWKHMKKCRDKNCKTAHCLSSRCVLNHYRICKGENKTSSCEVCAPVMKQIRIQNSQSGVEEPMDAFSRDQTRDLQPGEETLSSSASTQNQPGGSVTAQQKRKQLEELQVAQQKLQQQQIFLKQLQQQQARLLEQQRQLQQQQQHVLPQTPQGQQLQQQEILLQELQQQFQKQQLLLQQDLLRKSQNPDDSRLARLGSPDDGGESNKVKRRSSQSRKASRKGSASSKGSRKRFGKGKSLSSMETTASELNEDSSVHDVGDAETTIGSTGKSKKRQASAEIDEPQSKLVKEELEVSENTPDTQRSDADTAENPAEQKKVLQQGTEEHNTALIPSMTVEAIERHLESLHDSLHLTPRTISQKCAPVLQSLLEDQFGWVFRDPVDPVVLGLPDYFDVVKCPMHLALVAERVENCAYKDLASFANDAKLVFENAILYNGDESEVGAMAQSMLNQFEREFGAVQRAIKTEEQLLKKKGDSCSLCGAQRRLFEPTVLYCNGACGMQKIRRNASYYTDQFKLNHWCSPCFSLMKEDDPVVLDDGKEIRKTDLQKLKNDALPEEAWVQCDDCHSWVHQICALFNGRKNKMDATYTCPKCHIKKVELGEGDKPEQIMKCARDLPHCKMSLAIEGGLHAELERAYQARALEKGVHVDEVDKADGLTVRVVSNMEKTHYVREEMGARYARSGCPSDFPLRSKFIALFQTVHGVDTLLFGLYVYEYGQACPAPNRRRVYISYLDSVNYFEPKVYRTITYHAILTEYLRFVKDRGFHTAHIWSCPPSAGDDYIFYSHPSQQLIPRDEMLRAWYHEMLDKAKAQGIVLQTRTLYDEYFKNSGKDAPAGPAVDPTSLPYFEGDYIPGEIENIIKELNEQDEAKRKDGSTNKTSGMKLGTRSNPGDLISVGQDKVMMKLGQAISNMRDNFMVVHLHTRAFAAAVQNGEDVSNWVEEAHEDAPVLSKKMKPSGEDPIALDPLELVRTGVVKDADGAAPITIDGEEKESSIVDEGESPEKAIAMEVDTVPLTSIDDGKEGTSLGKERDATNDESGAVGSDLDACSGATKIQSPELGMNPPSKETAEAAQVEPCDETAVTIKPANEKDEDFPPGMTVETCEDKGPEMTECDNNPAGKSCARKSSLEEDALSNAKTHKSATPESQAPTTSEGIDERTSDKGSVSDDGLDTKGTKASTAGGAMSDPAFARVTEPATEPDWNDDGASQESFLVDDTTDLIRSDTGNRAASPGENQTLRGTGKDEASERESTDVVDVDVDLKLAEKSTSETDILGQEGDISSAGRKESLSSKRSFDEIKTTDSARRRAEPVGSTVDEDEPIENEMFESRQQFLNYCQTNHFQFDELRRAKHTTMMILFQLHNPNAPKFLQQCGSCYREITHGVRYHCSSCSNFDLCQDCYEPVITGLWAQRDSRFAHDKDHSFTPINMEAPLDTQKSREERARALKVHLELLAHAGSCEGAPGCTLKNCEKMKNMFEHVKSCEVTYKKGCKKCSRLLSLITMHSRQCSIRGSCPIPFCDRTRERNRRLRQQQQQMDDRRRNAQNKLYRESGSA